MALHKWVFIENNMYIKNIKGKYSSKVMENIVVIACSAIYAAESHLLLELRREELSIYRKNHLLKPARVPDATLALRLPSWYAAQADFY
jgi:hypothetical protein